VDSGSAKVKP